ncbi:hypothetical protein [Candidatus Ichthyocystis hellenicum]|uniref:hypothetical protein n=1 Tax=Candidatus Ichthyocystis hellenicum TaxID=1561003 RepID=UPI001584B832|nr:hypothetical protein [Candidatus Ichthyocystis hellenicum]
MKYDIIDVTLGALPLSFLFMLPPTTLIHRDSGANEDSNITNKVATVATYNPQSDKT